MLKDIICRKKVLVASIAFLFSAALFASVIFAQNAQNSASSASKAIPSSYRKVSLGMSLDEVKSALLSDSIFGYRGERDVSLIPNENRQLIETAGPSFIRMAWFQFYDSRLYNMSFALDTNRLDYFTILTHLSEKYGEPEHLSPTSAVWSSGSVRLSLERPLTIKYMDSGIFSSILESEYDNRIYEDILRENFVSDF